MLEQSIEICPVFTRWQVQCHKCGMIFYIDAEPEAIEEDILRLDDMKCGFHPKEDSVVTLV